MLYQWRVYFCPIVAERGKSMWRNCDPSCLWFGGCLEVRKGAKREGQIALRG